MSEYSVSQMWSYLDRWTFCKCDSVKILDSGLHSTWLVILWEEMIWHRHIPRKACECTDGHPLARRIASEEAACASRSLVLPTLRIVGKSTLLFTFSSLVFCCSRKINVEFFFMKSGIQMLWNQTQGILLAQGILIRNQEPGFPLRPLITDVKDFFFILVRAHEETRTLGKGF